MKLESDMRDREAYVGRLSQQLQASIAEAKSAQAATLALQHEIETYKTMLTKVAELSGEVSRYDGQLKSMAQEFTNKGTQLDRLVVGVPPHEPDGSHMVVGGDETIDREPIDGRREVQRSGLELKKIGRAHV